jgi:hydroxyacylglutathione hydrolase
MTTDSPPGPGVPERFAADIVRVLAPNPSPMTLTGTNTWLVGGRALAVIDPGPDDPAHLAAILAAVPAGARISHIVVTHTHVDHSPLAGPLAAATGAPVLAFGDAAAGRSPRLAALARIGGGEGIDAAFRPDRTLPDGAVVEGEGWRLEAVHTPGHIGNHLCLRLGDTLFSGDHVMGWAPSLVSPPDGDMAAYMASLARVGGLGARRLLPGHGPAVENPAARIAELTAHRRGREASILAAVRAGATSVAEVTRRVYTDIPAALWPGAERNVLAHLIDLADRGQVTATPAPAPDARFVATPERG